ncbi:MAG TPA: mandelate racemase/muconate lactonizing enzyme family protein, partial [Chloroflexota bacterium]|nr:mandelate racemase/muconate lactonizing enzyme family protein [Chloroflexota bacterium]
MKITDIKTYPVFVGSRNQCIVKVETDEGLFGWGESGLSARELAVAAAIRHFREYLVGKNPLNIGAIWQELYRSNYFEGGRVLTAAISAIDIALYDLAGKALGVPVHQLLGGKQRDSVPGFATTQASTLEGLIADVRLLLENDWRCIRANPGFVQHDAPKGVYEPTESITLAARWLARIREEVGTDFIMGTDYHHRLTVAESAMFCNRMPAGTLDWLEEPIRAESPEAYASLRTMIDVPLAIGEEFSSKWAFLPFIERGLTNFARVDVCNVGGLTEAMKVAAMAEAHYIDMMPHNPLGPICTAATVHFAAAIPNLSWVEVRTTPTEHLGF